MNFDRLKNLIFEIVLNEIGETNVMQFGSEALMGRITQELAGVVSKYGGDHDKAYASPEWKQITTNAEKTIGREKTNSLLGRAPVEPPPGDIFNANNTSPEKKQTINPPPKDLFNTQQKQNPTGTTPTTSTSAAPATSNSQPNTKVFKKPVDTATAGSLANQSLANKNVTKDRLQALRTTPKLQEAKMTGITKTITEMARKVLKEEIEIFERELNVDGPSHGESMQGPDGQRYTYQDSSQTWLSDREWSDVSQGETENDSLLTSQLGDDDSLTGEDPQMDDSPADREAMIDSLMMMEFDSSSTKKISSKVLEALVRKRVRASLRGEE